MLLTYQSLFVRVLMTTPRNTVIAQLNRKAQRDCKVFRLSWPSILWLTINQFHRPYFGMLLMPEQLGRHFVCMYTSLVIS